ncbi:MAG: ATP-grasp domain-containing protein, partial [Candidatus Xenobia bacterium]
MKIGVLSGQEAFTDALVDTINAKNVPGLTAEFCHIKQTRQLETSQYRLILDRISHWVEYYRTHLKNAALTGTYVINNPFWFSADDKFYNYSLAADLGVAVPRTVCLPSRSYDEDVTPEDLKNLDLPLQWEEIIAYVGFPAILKPYNGYGWRDVTKVEDMDELLAAYEESGDQVMILQEYIEFEHYVRAFVIGRKHVLPIKYAPEQRRYIIDHRHMSDEMGLRVVNDCLKLNEALGYD